jgi:hypothetical protein
MAKECWGLRRGFMECMGLGGLQHPPSHYIIPEQGECTKKRQRVRQIGLSPPAAYPYNTIGYGHIGWIPWYPGTTLVCTEPALVTLGSPTLWMDK